MNKYNITSFIIGFVLLGSFSLYAQNHQILMKTVLDSYQTIGKTLSQGSNEGISLEAKKIISNTIKLKSDVLKEKAKQFNTLMNRIMRHAQSLLNEKDVKLLRDKYDLLSHDMLGYLNTFGSPTEYFMYACTGDLMHWVQQGKNQNDPYCDNPCGKIISVIK